MNMRDVYLATAVIVLGAIGTYLLSAKKTRSGIIAGLLDQLAVMQRSSVEAES